MQRVAANLVPASVRSQHGFLRMARSLSSTTSAFSEESRQVCKSLKGRHLMNIDDYSPKELEAVLSLSHELKRQHKAKNVQQLLQQESVAMIFQKRSTRTRVSTETGMFLLGGHSLFLSSDDVQLGVNETIKDSAIVLSRFNSLLLARVFEHTHIEALAEHSTVPVINALSHLHHPLQTLADVMTLQETYPASKGGLAGRTLCWVGDGNNVLHDLMLAAPVVKCNIQISTPVGYEPDAGIVARTQELAAEHGTSVVLVNDPKTAVKGADVLFTDTWVSMGEEEQAKKKMKDFEGYSVTEELARTAGANTDWKFMHCLPRHEEEVSDKVFYSERSLVFDEAENRMYTVMAVMATMLGKVP